MSQQVGWATLLAIVVNAHAKVDELSIRADQSHVIGQYENLLVWYGQESPELTFPTAHIEHVGDITFVAYDQTWMAIHSFDQGFALEISEFPTYRYFADFKQTVVDRAQLIVADGQVEYRGSNGKTLAISLQVGRLPSLWRNGAFSAHR